MTGPRLTVLTLARLIFLGLCIAGVIAVCWAVNLWSKP